MAEPLLLEAGVALTVLAAAGALAWRLGQSVIPAYLLAGIAIGPYAPRLFGVSLTLVERTEFIDLFAELGVVFLLFFIGVEFSVGKLLTEPRRIVAAGGLDLAVNIALGVGLGLAVGLTLLESLFLAGVVYPSSSAVITKSLVDLGWIADPESEAVIGVLVVEDVLMAGYLALLAALAIGGPSRRPSCPWASRSRSCCCSPCSRPSVPASSSGRSTRRRTSCSSCGSSA